MQTGVRLISLVMQRSAEPPPGWVVATHGLDLLRLLVYLVWFPLLARDFFRLARVEKR